jgi:hypothetical protein
MCAHIDGACELPLPAAAPCESQKVPIRSLLSGDSPRINGEDDQHIDLLAQMDKLLPPILVQRGTMRVIDGMHRLRAAILLGHESIEVRFFDGTDAEAFIAAVKANTEHGLPLTLEDREAAASRIIALYPQQSDRWIARVTGLAPGTVGSVRRAAGGDSQPTRRIGRDGRVRPINSADGRRMAMNAITENPDAPLRVIARMSGISPGTVRDVRKRMLRGEDPVARKLPGSTPAERRHRSAGDPENRSALTSAPPTRDFGTLLGKLRKDPSLRFNETGRRLLRWLDAQTAGPGELEALADTIPSHCLHLIAELARCCANEWLDAARRLQQRGDDAQLYARRRAGRQRRDHPGGVPPPCLRHPDLAAGGDGQLTRLDQGDFGNV